MNPKAYAKIGTRLAESIFQARTLGTKEEDLIGKVELAAMLALAVEEGWKRGYDARRKNR